MAMNEFNQRDSDIERDRASRAMVAFFLPIVVLITGYLIGIGFAGFFKLPSLLGMSMGFGIGGIGTLWLIPRLFVQNPAVHAFVTVDLFTNELVSYGPGFHFSFPWESRSQTNNANLKEVTEQFSFSVQTEAGTLHGKGSFRLRPDIQGLPHFLAGVGSVDDTDRPLTSGMSDLITASCAENLKASTFSDMGGKLKELNITLTHEFKHGKTQAKNVSEFEQRFGVIIGDVTVNELLPSKEVRKAMDGMSENVALESIIARNLGKRNMTEVHEAVESEKLTSKEVAQATKLAMAMTDNLHGLDVRDHSINLEIGGDPEVVKALGPLGALLASQFTQQAKEGKKNG